MGSTETGELYTQAEYDSMSDQQHADLGIIPITPEQEAELSPMELKERKEQLLDMAQRLDDDPAIRYEIRKAGRIQVYRTKLYKYKHRHAEKVGTFKTMSSAHKYISKRVNKKEKHGEETKPNTEKPEIGRQSSGRATSPQPAQS
jgi:hypothetical protein